MNAVYLVVEETPGNPENPDDQNKKVVINRYWAQAPATSLAKRYASYRQNSHKEFYVIKITYDIESGECVRMFNYNSLNK